MTVACRGESRRREAHPHAEYGALNSGRPDGSAYQATQIPFHTAYSRF
jgi:hypothetical protein